VALVLERRGRPDQGGEPNSHPSPLPYQRGWVLRGRVLQRNQEREPMRKWSGMVRIVLDTLEGVGL